MVPGILDQFGAFRPLGARAAPRRHFVMDLRGPWGVRYSIAGAPAAGDTAAPDANESAAAPAAAPAAAADGPGAPEPYPPGAYVFRVPLDRMSALGQNRLAFRFLPSQHTASSTPLEPLCAGNTSAARGLGGVGARIGRKERADADSGRCRDGRLMNLHLNVSAQLSVELAEAPRTHVTFGQTLTLDFRVRERATLSEAASSGEGAAPVWLHVLDASDTVPPRPPKA
jgi:hypothetical protein